MKEGKIATYVNLMDLNNALTINGNEYKCVKHKDLAGKKEIFTNVDYNSYYDCENQLVYFNDCKSGSLEPWFVIKRNFIDIDSVRSINGTLINNVTVDLTAKLKVKSTPILTHNVTLLKITTLSSPISETTFPPSPTATVHNFSSDPEMETENITVDLVFSFSPITYTRFISDNGGTVKCGYTIEVELNAIHNEEIVGTKTESKFTNRFLTNTNNGTFTGGTFTPTVTLNVPYSKYKNTAYEINVDISGAITDLPLKI